MRITKAAIRFHNVGEPDKDEKPMHFVTREEASKIAFEAGQTKELKKRHYFGRICGNGENVFRSRYSRRS